MKTTTMLLGQACNLTLNEGPLLRRRPRLLRDAPRRDRARRAPRRGRLRRTSATAATREGKDPGEWPGTYRHIREVVAPLCARTGSSSSGSIDSPPTRCATRARSSRGSRRASRSRSPARAHLHRRSRRSSASSAGSTTATPTRTSRCGSASRPARRRARRRIRTPPKRKPRKPRPGDAVRVNRFPLMERGLCRCRCEDLVRAAGSRFRVRAPACSAPTRRRATGRPSRASSRSLRASSSSRREAADGEERDRSSRSSSFARRRAPVTGAKTYLRTMLDSRAPAGAYRGPAKSRARCAGPRSAPRKRPGATTSKNRRGLESGPVWPVRRVRRGELAGVRLRVHREACPARPGDADPIRIVASRGAAPPGADQIRRGPLPRARARANAP
jgi:hypothetical protein